MKALIKKINSEALVRIFLNSLDNTRYDKLKSRIENTFAEGGDVYPADVGDMLTRAQNYSMPKKPFVRNTDALAFASTTNGPNMGRTNKCGHSRGGYRNIKFTKTCY